MDIAVSHQCRGEMRTCTTSVAVREALAGVQLEMNLWTAVPHRPSTLDQTALTDHFKALFGQIVSKGACTIPLQYTEVNYCALLCHLLLLIIFGDPTEVNLPLVWLMLAIQITQNAC